MAKFIKIYGERNTNTNYMSKLISLNLDVIEVSGVVHPVFRIIQGILPGSTSIKDLYFSLTYGRNLGWKHTSVKPLENLQKYKIVNPDLVFLTITKNPYSWLLSLFRRPYSKINKGSPNFETFLQREWKTIGRDNIKTKVQNPIELWNIKNRSYLRLTSENSVHIKTEDIFEDPEAIIQNLSNKYSMKRKSESFINFERSTKKVNKDTAYYRDYYLSEKWQDKLSKEAITIINESIDQELMAHFNYKIIS